MKRLATFTALLLVCAFVHPRVFAAEAKTPTKTIYQAVAMGDVDEVNLHITRGIDLDKSDSNRNTPLGIAIESGRSPLVAILLEAGADPSVPSRDVAPLITATVRGNADAVKALLAHGAKVDTPGAMGMTPLLVASESGHVAVAEMLIAAGANVNARDQRGQTPLGIANMRQQTEIASLLREHGAQEPVNDFDTGPYGSRGLRAAPGAGAYSDSASSAGYQDATANTQILADPNEIRTRLAAFPGLSDAIATVDANSESEQRNWRQRRMDNRTLLIRSVEKQFEDEMAFAKSVAQAEKALKTLGQIDELVAKRKARYATISDDLREERRAAMLEERETTTRTRSSGRSRGRTGAMDSTTAGGTSDLYGAAPARPAPRPRPNRDVNEPVLDAVTENQAQAWLGVDPLDKRGLLNAVHQVDLQEYDALRQTAAAEEAQKTAAAIEGLMLARQERLTAVNVKMLEEDERLQRLEERAGATMTPGAGRGRGTRGTTPTEDPATTTTQRRGRRVR